MAHIFSTKPGRVVKLDIGDGQVEPGLVVLDPALTAATLVITKFQMDHNVNVQFQKTLQKAVYAYVFGDMPGDIIISGFAFLDKCESGDSSLKVAMDYYKNNRMAIKLEPIKITFADRVIEGHLIGCQFSTADADSYMCQFTFLLKAAALES